MATSQPLPDRQELEALAHTAFLNCQQQVASAELLLEHGRWPVAHALATLALEEIGKSFLCIFASTSPESFRDYFWKAFTTHTTKIHIAHVVLAPLAAAETTPEPVVQAIEAFGRMAKADHSTKMRGLYVDYTNGLVLNPADITEQDARSMVSHVRAALDLLAPVTNDYGLIPEFTSFLSASSAHLNTLIDSPDISQEDLLQQIWDEAEAVASGHKPPSWLPPDLLPESGSDSFGPFD